MRKFCFVKCMLVIAVMIAAPGRVRTQGKFGVGVILGEPTGVAWKYRLSEEHALDGAIGLSPGDRFRLHVDYLWEKHSFQEEHLLLHYGAGVVIGAGGPGYLAFERGETYVFAQRELGFAMRGVAGLTYAFPHSPFDAFVEIAPLLILAPASGMGIDAAVGARIYP